MKTRRSWVIVIVTAALVPACLACKGGGGGGRATPALAPGATAGSSGERGRITFQLEQSEPSLVRVYVGRKPREYEASFDLGEIRRMDAVLSAIEPRLARQLGEPDVYFVALTVVDALGRESAFSNEVRVDTRRPDARSADGSQRAAWSAARGDRRA